MKPIVGIRYRCKECKNFDYCENCMEKNINIHKHQFEKIEKPVEGALLKSEEIIQSFEAYKKYPHETKEIIDNYKTENSWGDEISLIPTEKDVKLYIENREEFDNKYSKQ